MALEGQEVQVGPVGEIRQSEQSWSLWINAIVSTEMFVFQERTFKKLNKKTKQNIDCSGNYPKHKCICYSPWKELLRSLMHCGNVSSTYLWSSKTLASSKTGVTGRALVMSEGGRERRYETRELRQQIIVCIPSPILEQVWGAGGQECDIACILQKKKKKEKKRAHSISWKASITRITLKNTRNNRTLHSSVYKTWKLHFQSALSALSSYPKSLHEHAKLQCVTFLTLPAMATLYKKTGGKRRKTYMRES